MQTKLIDAIRTLVATVGDALDDGAAFRDADTEQKLSAAARDASAALQSVDAIVAALRTLLDDAEGIAAPRGAYGMPITDEEHPWHESVMAARAALASIDAYGPGHCATKAAEAAALADVEREAEPAAHMARMADALSTVRTMIDDPGAIDGPTDAAAMLRAIDDALGPYLDRA